MKVHPLSILALLTLASASRSYADEIVVDTCEIGKCTRCEDGHERWYLSAGAGGWYVHVSARCLKYSQNQW
jgi:hypothetical protein